MGPLQCQCAALFVEFASARIARIDSILRRLTPISNEPRDIDVHITCNVLVDPFMTQEVPEIENVNHCRQMYQHIHLIRVTNGILRPIPCMENSVADEGTLTHDMLEEGSNHIITEAVFLAKCFYALLRSVILQP